MIRPVEPGTYAVVVAGQQPAMFPRSRDRWAVIAGRFTRDGEPFISLLVRGVEVATAVEFGVHALVASAGDGLWLDHATLHAVRAVLIGTNAAPNARLLRHPALAGWFSDARAGAALRRADPLRWMHLDGERTGRWPAWADSGPLAPDEDARAAHPLLATVAIDGAMRSNTWEALARGAQGVLWQAASDAGAHAVTARALSDAIRMVTPLLSDGTRVWLESGPGLIAAQWELNGQRLLVVVNRRTTAATVEMPSARGLVPLEKGAEGGLPPGQTVIELPPGVALVLHGDSSGASLALP